MAVFCIETLPQIIVLMIMLFIYSDDYSLSEDPTGLVTCSFSSCVLMVIAISIILPSIFEKTSMYIMGILWTLFDYSIFLFIFATAFYDDIGLTVAIIDASLLFVVMAIFIILRANESCTCKGVSAVFWMIVFSAILFPFVWIIIGPLSMIIICLLTQTLYTNIIPFSTNFLDIKYDSKFIGYSAKYRAVKWIESAEDKNERNFRLNCVNMVIMDQYHKGKLKEIKQSLATQIKEENNLSADVTDLIKKSDHSRYQLFKVPAGDASEVDRATNQFWVLSTYFFIINRIIHILLPIIIIIHIGNKENWMLDNVNFIIRLSGYSIIILFPLCIVSIFPVWYSCDTHRLILPYWNEMCIDDNNNKPRLEQMTAYIANCHASTQSLKILMDILGSKDVVGLILEYAGLIVFENKKKNLKQTKHQTMLTALLLGAGQVGNRPFLNN